MRAMTFNIRGSFHRDGKNSWPHRRDLNVSTIKKQDPDIIAFQEVQEGNFCDYKHSLCDDYSHVVGHVCDRDMQWNLLDLCDLWKESESFSGAMWNIHSHIFSNIGESCQQDEHAPIYWKKERFVELNNGAFYLSQTPDTKSVGWESQLIRAATWVILKEKASGAEFIVLNTHYPHERHEATRSECSLVILQQLTTLAPDLPHIVMGDFNCHASPQCDAYSFFVRNGYQDTYKDSKRINTFHNFEGDRCSINLGRIDWILIKNQPSSEEPKAEVFVNSEAQIVRDAEPPIFPSDHYPIVADLGLATISS